MSEPTNRPPLFEVTTWIGLTASLIYVAGWSYAYHYFDAFGIGLVGLDLPNDFLFIYGFWVIKAWWGLVFFYLLLIGLPKIYASETTRLAAWIHPYRWQLMPLGVIALFLGAYWLGNGVAVEHFETQRRLDFPDYPRVRVWLKPTAEAPQQLTMLREDLADGCHRLLLESGGTLYLFRSDPVNRESALAINEVPISGIHAMRVLPQYQSCVNAQ